MKACNPDGKRTGNADLRNCFRRPTNRYFFFFVIYKSFSVQYSPSCPFSNMRTWKQLVIEARFLFFCLLVFNVFDLKSCGSLFPHPR